ncbi:MAG: IS110 family transposase [Chitinivibrionales bacterium]|nr:IS110 family transposase [Chitinivibrionales bacterium]
MPTCAEGVKKATFFLFRIFEPWSQSATRKGGSLMGKMLNHVQQGQKVFVGLEDSKRSWKLCIRSEGMVVQELSMGARYEDLRRFFEGQYPRCDIGVIYETGFRGFTLHDRLVADGYGCVVTPAHTVVDEKGNKVKCDKKDARRLALNFEKGDYTKCDVPDEELRQDRQISRTLIQIQKDISRTKNRIRKFLDFHGYDEAFAPGRWYQRDYHNLDPADLSEPLECCMDIYREQLKMLLEMKRRLRRKLRALSKKERYCKQYDIFRSAPGVGWFTAIRLVLEWGDDLSRFQTAKQFAGFTGLTGSEFSTGETVRRGHINRQGRPHVRAWLVECAWTAYKRDPVLLKKYQAVYRSSGSAKKAIVAVAHKLAVRLRAIAIRGETYQIGLIQ